MDWLSILQMLIIVATFVVGTLVPTGVALKKSWNARKNAETDAAKEKANADLLATAKGFISAAEVTFAEFDKLLKQSNGSAGGLKKDTVINKLQAYALQNGYEFNVDEWSDKIDELVAFTKSVNAKKSA